MTFAVIVAAAVVLDCGSNWQCFEDAFSRSRPASVVKSFSTNGDGSVQTTSLRFQTLTITPSSVVLAERMISAAGREKDAAARRLAAAQGTCTFRLDALRNMLLDIDMMGQLSPQSFVAAESCSGRLFPSFPQMKAAIPSTAIVAPGRYINCSFSLGCVIRALDKHRAAAVWTVASIPLFGLNITAASQYRTSNISATEVSFYEKTLKTVVSLDAETVKQMRAKGLSSAQIAAAQAKANTKAATTAGLEGACRFKIQALKQVLRQWYEGSYSSADWTKAERCRGSMFGAPK